MEPAGEAGSRTGAQPPCGRRHSAGPEQQAGFLSPCVWGRAADRSQETGPRYRPEGVQRARLSSVRSLLMARASGQGKAKDGHKSPSGRHWRTLFFYSEISAGPGGMSPGQGSRPAARWVRRLGPAGPAVTRHLCGLLHSLWASCCAGPSEVSGPSCPPATGGLLHLQTKATIGHWRVLKFSR